MKVNLYQLLIIILAGWNSVGFSQTYYYSNNQQIQITENKSSVILLFDTIYTNFSYNDEDSLVSDIEYSSDSSGIIINLNSEWPNNINDLITYLGIDENYLNGSSFCFVFEDGVKIYPSFNIVMKLNEGFDENDIDSLFIQNNLTYKKTEMGCVFATASTPGATIDAANAINNNSMIEWCHPDFLIKAIPAATHPTDAFYNNQYYLNNTGQNGGTPDADIDAPEAWDITTGNNGNNTIKIAVVDEGIDPHPDLEDANGNSRILSGWSYNGAVNPIPGSLPGSAASPSEKHGTRVAGIIAASQGYTSNACGVSGVCPNCKIIPVRRPSVFTNASDFAQAIYQAWNILGADIINNSYNLGVVPNFQIITFQINQALNFGRGGKGCPVVFSAGNNGPGPVLYPATIPGVISVSALDKNGNLSSYSRTGTQVVISAFGGDPSDIYTTNNVGNGNIYSCTGYDYFNGMGGTSAACAQVSGIIGLLLSVDNNLTAVQCSCRVANTATDIGAYGVDNNYGHGRADAYYCIALYHLRLIDEQIAGQQNYASTSFITAPAPPSVTSMNGCEILAGANVNLVTGRSVMFDPGFVADYGSVLSATLNTTTPCGINGIGPFRNASDDSIIFSSNNLDLNKLISIFPNPALNSITVSTLKENIIINKIVLLNTLGQKIKLYNKINSKSYQVNFFGLPSGIYALSIETNEGLVVKKFLKQ